ncbi:hypothetical protein G5B40_16905 [Pikeienuella piscinae]|uniref:AMIN domain-containing protein n=1 Tax=Pikeienuella piscinae TaxID=2748098 RepID=A0A7L5BX59_9RHOB|nr:hypothetical protein [Pikeienuella piscinae]QIE56970.1 hypothetical protein G5B40_16905 [Pikeienuella piscinae]
MRRAPLIIAALSPALLAGVAAAEDGVVRLRASDVAHASRVEIPLGSTGFGIERTGARQIDLVITGEIGALDFSEIFPDARARRIVSARLAPDETAARLRFVLGCDCEYAARLEGGVLALEFRDPAQASEGADGSDAPRARQRAANEGTDRAPWRAPAPVPRGGSVDGGAPGAAPEDAPAEEIMIARRRLLEQLSRAADQGLVEFRSPEAEAAAASSSPAYEPAPAAAPQPPTPTETADAAPRPDAAPPEPPEMPPAPPAPLEIPVRARTAVDRAFPVGRGDTLAESAPCVADERLDVAAWPDPKKFVSERVRFSAVLIDEFGGVAPDAATGLARLYVAAGFGREALGVLDLFPNAVTDAALIRDLAHVVEGRRPPRDGPLAGAGPCSGRMALWFTAAGLRRGPVPDAAAAAMAEIDEEMIAAFAMLPASFRVLLGPMLMDDLLDRGETEKARRIDLILRRIPGDHGAAFDLARARLLTETGEETEAEALYARLGRRDLPESRDALLRLLQSRIARGAPIGVDLAEALATAAFIARGGPMERALKTAEIRARARAEGLGPALATVREAISRAPEAAIMLRDAGHAALEEAAADPKDGLAYTRAVMAHQHEISTEMAGDAARRRVAEELTTLGLANAALNFLKPAIGRGAPGVRRAEARARLALEDAEGALTALEGLNDLAAERLRAAAEEMQNRPAAALETLSGLEEAAGAEARAALAFRAGAWPAAAAAGPPARRLLAAYMARSRPEGAPAAALPPDLEGAADFVEPRSLTGEVTLGKARSVMEASAAARAIIKEALEDG